MGIADDIINKEPRRVGMLEASGGKIEMSDGSTVVGSVGFGPSRFPELEELARKAKAEAQENGIIGFQSLGLKQVPEDKLLAAYDKEINAIGIILKTLAPLHIDEATRVINYAIMYVQDRQKK